MQTVIDREPDGVRRTGVDSVSRANQDGKAGLIRHPGQVNDAGMVLGNGIVNFNRRRQRCKRMAARLVLLIIRKTVAVIIGQPVPGLNRYGLPRCQPYGRRHRR